MSRGGQLLVLAAAVALVAGAGCLEAPPRQEADGGGGGPVDDGGPPITPDATACVPVFVDDFEGGSLGGDWIVDDGESPTVADGAARLELDGSIDGDVSDYIYTDYLYPPDQLTFEVEVEVHVEGEGEAILEVSPADGIYYNFYAYGAVLQAIDSGNQVCTADCAPLLQDQLQRWRVRPVNQEIWFEVDLGDGWQQIGASSDVRPGPHHILFFVDTDGEGDVARILVHQVEVLSCP